MSLSLESPLRVPRIALRPTVEIGAAALFAYFQIWISFALMTAYGRLAAPAAYDDVSYFIAGQAWLNSWASDGIFAGLSGILNQHAPLSMLVAAASFAALGPYDWAPYLANGALLGFTLWALMRLLASDGVSLPVSLIVAFSLATMPFAMHLVSEFRPDLYTGVLLGFCIFLLFRKPVFLASRRAQFLLGLLFGATLLAKPSTFPAVGFLFAAAALLSSAAFIIEQKLDPRAQLLPLGKAAGIVSLAAAIVFVPYLLAQGSVISGYIFKALVTEIDVWSVPGAAFDQTVYYAVNLYTALGFWLWVGLLTFAVRLWATVRFVPREFPVTCCSYAMLLVIYAGISWTSHKNYFFGGLFYGPFILLMARDWAWLLMRWPIRMFAHNLYPAHIVLGTCALVGTVFAFRAPQPVTILAPQYNAHMVELTQTLWAMMIDFAKSQTAAGLDPKVKILANAPDPMRVAAIELQGLREGLNVQVDHGYLIASADAFLQRAEKADLIVVASSAPGHLPGPALGDAFQQAIMESGRYRVVQSYPGLAVQSVTVFAHVDPADLQSPDP
jgi:hypothetical protein